MRLLLLVAAYLIAPSVIAQDAANNYYDPLEMAKARAALKSHHGDQINMLVLGERVEYHSSSGDPVVVWEGQGWIGKDEHKLWIKTEGEYDTKGEVFEEVELQALYSKAISPFWDFQVGLRYNAKPTPSRAYGTIGVQGLAPYWFELDAAIFVSQEGNISTRLEAEYELRITQRLILQPRVEINAGFSDDDDIRLGAGVSTSDIGLRLRYEIVRQFAPYVGIAWSNAFGETEDLQRAENINTSQLSLVAGVRFWF